ncbi:BON domain-containing protein [Stenotrophomonas acidaminiphila]|uniref:BON domain-containing protein n=1 Tax=Stenotrophomonas acidaminiphila TaxID=128780 RepID=UPI00289E19CD|nr:BON domain-containing protein [Stenotrophomonas acidaminiphila]WPU56574.1 BON domain-containing protein [Stenotrophomonas acidaminiphila]
MSTHARTWMLLAALGCGLSLALPLQALPAPGPLPLPPAPETDPMSDAWITTRIRAALVPLQRDAAVDVRVNTTAGIVTLEGVVDSPLARERVLERVAAVRGVRGVEAQALRIAGAAPYP